MFCLYFSVDSFVNPAKAPRQWFGDDMDSIWCMVKSHDYVSLANETTFSRLQATISGYVFMQVANASTCANTTMLQYNDVIEAAVRGDYAMVDFRLDIEERFPIGKAMACNVDVLCTTFRQFAKEEEGIAHTALVSLIPTTIALEAMALTTVTVTLVLFVIFRFANRGLWKEPKHIVL